MPKVIKDLFGIIDSLQDNVLGLLNMIAEICNRRSTKGIIDNCEHCRWSKRVRFTITQKLENVANSENRFTDIFAFEISDTKSDQETPGSLDRRREGGGHLGGCCKP
eukprot:scaffold3127_cov117-Amphora_coffeaeformis.AAC.2